MANQLGNSRASLVSWNSYNESLGNPYYGQLDAPIMKAYRTAYDAALIEAAEEIQAKHPGEVKASAEFLKKKAST